MISPALAQHPFALTNAELDIIRAQPKVLLMCPKLQEAKDKKLKSALAAELGKLYSALECGVLVDRVMAVIKEQR